MTELRQIYQDARDLGYSRVQALVLVWQGLDPADYEPDGTPYERGRKLAGDLYLIVKFWPMFGLCALIWVSSEIAKRVRKTGIKNA